MFEGQPTQARNLTHTDPTRASGCLPNCPPAHLPAPHGCQSWQTGCWRRCGAAPAVWAAAPAGPAAPSTCCRAGWRGSAKGGASSQSVPAASHSDDAASQCPQPNLRLQSHASKHPPELPLHVVNVAPVATAGGGLVWAGAPHHHRLPRHLPHSPQRQLALCSANRQAVKQRASCRLVWSACRRSSS
jgi:hypothetical protein